MTLSKQIRDYCQRGECPYCDSRLDRQENHSRNETRFSCDQCGFRQSVSNFKLDPTDGETDE